MINKVLKKSYFRGFPVLLFFGGFLVREKQNAIFLTVFQVVLQYSAYYFLCLTNFKLKQMDDKTKAIVAHIYWVGWVIALIFNLNERKEALTTFYLRQLLGLFLFALVIMWIPFLNLIAGILVLVFWIISLIGAINGEQKEIPWIGKYFQEWFAFL